MKTLIFSIILILINAGANAQTCNSSVSTMNDDKRYTPLSSGQEIKDEVTGLIWQRCSIGQKWDGNSSNCIGDATLLYWPNALEQAKNIGGSYRLPNIRELQSLIEPNCEYPALNIKSFPNTPLDERFLSSSPSSSEDESIWGVFFRFGIVDDITSINPNSPFYSKGYVRAVR